MKLDDFKNKKITVMGIGLHGGGVGVIKFVAAQGAKILATDLKKASELKKSLQKLKGLAVEYILGRHRLEDFTNTDMVIKNPGVPEDSTFLAAAREKKIPIESDIGIFFELCPAPIIGVTGTKGKSTTAALLAQILRLHFRQVILAGNIRASVLEALPKITKDTIVVLELSSWQLADAKNHKKSPYVAVITNILADHLNRYRSFQDYIEDKKLIFKFQKGKDYLFLNYTDPTLKEFSKEATSRIYFYSVDGESLLQGDLPRLNQKARMGAYVRGKKIYYGAAQDEICTLKDVKLIGQHNLANILAAVSVADLYNVPRPKIKKAVQQFNGLPGRLEFIAQINGVNYVNDTTATAPAAAIAAISALTNHDSPNTTNHDSPNTKHLILIAGGADKNLEFGELSKVISEKCRAVVLLEGTATDKLAKEIGSAMPLKRVSNMAKAVALASQAAKPGNTVLLSPGCASFGLFKHEFERGEAFNAATAALKIQNAKCKMTM